MEYNDSLNYEIARFKERATANMDPVAKELLVEALRSGKYPQTTGYLQVLKDLDPTRPAGFCCLGVLSEIAIEAGVQVTRKPHDLNMAVMEYTGPSNDVALDRSTAFLVSSVEEWANMPEGVSSAMMGINDAGGSFELIADLVQDYL